jgi:Acyltransferase family
VLACVKSGSPASPVACGQSWPRLRARKTAGTEKRRSTEPKNTVTMGVANTAAFMRYPILKRPSSEPALRYKISASGSRQQRIVGIDGFRFVAILAVIFSHMSGVFPAPVIGCSRFAVPFFFVMAGFFLAQPGPSLSISVARVCRRLLIPFAFWLAFYLLWFHPPAAAFREPMFLADLIIEGGPAYHLGLAPVSWSVERLGSGYLM